MSEARVNIHKKDLDTVYGTDYPCLSGHVRCYITWAVEQSRGLIKKKVDLNAFASVANAEHAFVGTAHQAFPTFDVMEYGGDTIAKAGGFAEEFVDIDLSRMTGRPDMSDIVFGATCLGNPLVMANLGQLQVRITRPTFEMLDDGVTIKRTKPTRQHPRGQRMVLSESTLVEGEYRSIEQPATAAVYLRFKLTPQGAFLRRINDSTDFVPHRRIDGNQAWRDLLSGLRDAVTREMVVPAA